MAFRSRTIRRHGAGNAHRICRTHVQNAAADAAAVLPAPTMAAARTGQCGPQCITVRLAFDSRIRRCNLTVPGPNASTEAAETGPEGGRPVARAIAAGALPSRIPAANDAKRAARQDVQRRDGERRRTAVRRIGERIDEGIGGDDKLLCLNKRTDRLSHRRGRGIDVEPGRVRDHQFAVDRQSARRIAHVAAALDV